MPLPPRCKPAPPESGNRLVFEDAQREIGLEEFVRHVGERGPQRMAVRTVARRAAGNAAEADLEELVPLALAVEARIHEVRAVGEARGVERLRARPGRAGRP